MNGKKITLVSLAGAMGLAITSVASGEVRWGGFLNAGSAVTDVKGTTAGGDEITYVDHIGDTASFSDTSFGLNASAAVSKRWRVAAQFYSPLGGDSVTLDWAFATYRASDELSFRAGKIKYPGNLVSEYYNVGYAYPWIRPPQEIYRHGESNVTMTLQAINGASLEYGLIGDEWEWSLMGYVGEADEENMSHKQMHAARLVASNDDFKVLLGVNRSYMERSAMAAMKNKWMTIWTAAAQMDWNNVVGYAEYVRSQTEDVDELTTSAWYLTGGYRFGSLMPHLTYTEMSQDTGIGQKTWTLGLRWDMAPSTALKAEYQQIDAQAATGGDEAGLFDGVPDNNPVNMLSFALNYVF